jgi:predicted Zn-dependent protease
MRVPHLFLCLLFAAAFSRADDLPEMKEAKKHFTGNKLDECLKSLKAAYVKDDVNLRPGEVTLAEWLYESKKTKESHKMIDEFIKQNPEKPAGYLLKAEFELIEKRNTDAMETYLKAMKLCKAENWSAKQRQRMEKNVRLGLIEMLESRQDYESMIEHLQALVIADSQNMELQEKLAATKKKVREARAEREKK